MEVDQPPLSKRSVARGRSSSFGDSTDLLAQRWSSSLGNGEPDNGSPSSMEILPLSSKGLFKSKHINKGDILYNKLLNNFYRGFQRISKPPGLNTKEVNDVMQDSRLD
ncbi:hypothetical protein Q3G72_006473 [Acer saccharum]|nr:hypothetical protein Q3G72_006473 [Acer saccharum]